MEWLNRLLAAIGLGGATVYVELQSEQHPRGAPVRARVLVQGGVVDQVIDQLTLSLVEFEQRPKRSEYTRVIDHRALATGLRIGPGEVFEFPIDLWMPDDVMLTRTGLFAPTAGVRLRAEGHVSMAVNLRRTTHLYVVRHRETDAVMMGLSALGFTPAANLSLTMTTTRREPRTVQAFAAPGDLNRLMDGVTADVTVSGQYVSCALEVNLQEQGAADRLKALVGQDRVRLDMVFTRADLLLPDGTPNAAGVAEEMRRALNDAVRDPAAPENVLLRPAAPPPADPAGMVRPAAYAPDTPAEQLLRPAPGQDEPEERGDT